MSMRFNKLSPLLVAGALLGFMLVPGNTARAASAETYEQLNLFGDIFERVRNDHVVEAKDGDLIEAAINGMLSSLDPHSSYMNADAYREMQVQTHGEFGGLGIEVTMENGVVKVVTPIDDTPAAKAGIQTGDYITHLDGKQVMGMLLRDAVELMRGPVNTTIKLSVVREGKTEPFDVVLKRAVITVQSVRTQREKEVAYIRVTAFNEHTNDSLVENLTKLKKEIGANFQGVILDLRNNPGGLLDQAIAVSDTFLERGEIVSTRGRTADDIQRFSATKGDLTDGKPVIVIINGGSASASEIVAGALQDHRRGIILGTTSFGKGSVQTIIPLGGKGALRMTTARYYTPSGRSIQATGIEPDIKVEQAKLEVVEPQRFRSEAELPSHLEGTVKKPVDDKPVSKDVPPVPDKTPGKAAPDAAVSPAKASPDAPNADYQLSYALDLLRGMSLMAQRAVN
ncbi:MAG: S41 family peptidase [Alphaproteobacteria bacterium]|nr:S41 family peptidase [Alphaproteobacteria bacterium]